MFECWNGEPTNRPSINELTAKLTNTQHNYLTNTKPSIQNINETIFEEDLSAIVYDLIDIVELNEGKEIVQILFIYLDTLIEVNINKQRGIELHQKAAKLENNAARFDLGYAEKAEKTVEQGNPDAQHKLKFIKNI
ncbi:kinase-like domain-containing protein [Rhizophagus clarus]|uniref:Kinase-like domain-containing protein n=1 Tax=Rhizophagus clarus TaxID=94130 RepID=A0A8H3QTA5_9GLOM|nr:kinase-like domain-containing protein [Rhizophagus clarus]